MQNKIKILFILLYCFLSACTFYTVTNNSSTDLKIETTNEITNLKAGECIELTEYFLGLAGDFPFVIVGEKAERSPGHYEIKTKEPSTQEPTEEPKSNNQPYTVSLSEKNTECNTKETTESDNNNNNDSNNNQTNLDPKATNWVSDPNKNIFCFVGKPTCSQGTFKCIKKEGASDSVPACVQGKAQTKAVVTCPSSSTVAENKALCLFPVEVTVANQTPLCGSGGTTKCSFSGQAVCGHTKGDTQLKAYCINKQNIRWGTITCSNGVLPSCNISV